MPQTIPSNCFSRRELHTLISRAHQLARQANGDMADRLVALAREAANIDGQLAEVAEDAEERHRHKDVLENPFGWEATWVETTQVVHTPGGKHVVKLAQQLLRSSQDYYVVTGRYRVTLGDRTFTTSNPAGLRGEVTAFVDAVPGLQEGLRTDLLAFTGVL